MSSPSSTARKSADASELQVVVGQQNPGTTIHLQVMRDGKDATAPVTLEAMGSRDKAGKETSDASKGKPRWGVGLSDITADVREQLQAPDDLHGAWSSKSNRAARPTTPDYSRAT